MQGVKILDSGKCYDGYTLFCHSYEDPTTAASGEGHIYLIDMEGRVQHEWRTQTAQQSFCRLLPNGNLLYPTRDRSRLEAAGLRELDPDSNVVWYYHCRIDHDCQVLENGNLMLHTITDRMVPALGVGLKRNPYMLEITRDKELVWEWRGEEHLDELEALLPTDGWAHFLERIQDPFAFDWAHNNTCQIIPPNATAEKEKAAGGPVRFKPGNIVFSYRSVDIIGVIERETGQIVWAWGPGELDGQHKPHMLPNGNLLIFDNGTLRGYSRVIELNPLTEEIVWEYVAEPKESFCSRYISGAQRLPNGNTLICEGASCHLFEVTPDKEVVWDYVSPFKEEGALAVYRCLRYAPEDVEALLGKRSP
ncbi:MAG: aryl-sulfate sulfotransferase [Anaerolineae bacterium]|nr:aryl-sulfate sulfotransferase [Anaerolineae bacterium]